MSLKSQIQSLSPSSYWILGEASGTVATDQQGLHNATYAGTVTLGQPALATSDPYTAAKFDGSTGKAQTPAGTYLETGVQQFTWWGVFQVATWSPTSGNYWRVMGADWYATNNGGVAIIGYTDANGSHLEAMRADPTSGSSADYCVADLPSASAANAWAISTTYDIGVTYDGYLLRLYVNGDLINSVISTRSIPTAPSGTAFSIASSGSGGNCGAVTAQHVARWGSALSGTQMYQLHQARLAQTATAATSLHCGAWVYNSRSNPALLDNFNALAGRRCGVWNDFYDLVQYPTPSLSFAQAVAARDATYLVTLEPWDSSGANTASYKCTNITAGTYDTQITAWANAIKAFPGTVAVRLAHEMNGNWYPWGCQGGYNGNAPADYVAMWKHIQSVFATAGCTNVKWVWCPIVYYGGSALLAPLYPGDASVDLVGLDGYNWGNNLYGSTQHIWQTGYDLFALSRTLLGQITTRPILICETACSESGATSGQTKAQWMTQFLSGDLPNGIPQAIGFVWFEQSKEENWLVESDSAAQSAFLSAVSAALYAAGPLYPVPFSQTLAAAAGAAASLAETITRYGTNYPEAAAGATAALAGLTVAVSRAAPALRPLTFTVNGQNLGGNVQVAGFKVEQAVSRRGDTAQFTVIDVGNQLTIGRFSAVTIADDQANVLFRGWATKIRTKTPSINVRLYELTCQDYTLFLTTRTQTKAYVPDAQHPGGWYVTDIARDLVLGANPPCGISANNTAPQLGIKLPYFKVNHAMIATELTRLAKLASVGVIWDWFVDYTGDLHFYYAAQAPQLPVTFTDADPPYAPNTWAYTRQDFSYETDDTQLGTQVTVRGGTYLSNAYTQTLYGNGVQTSWPFDYVPDIDQGGLPQVTVNGASQSVGQDNQSAVSTAWLVSQNVTTGAWTLKTGTASPPPSGATVQLTYRYDLPVLVRAKNGTGISALTNLPNQGVFERYVADPSISSKQHAHQRAIAEINAYSQSYVNAKLVTQDLASGANGIGRLSAGSKVTVVNQQLALNTQLLIIKLAIKGTKGGLYRYELDLQG